jgi:hypothetical protein
MRHETAQVFVSAGFDAVEIERKLNQSGTCRVSFARNLEGSWGAGDYTFDVVSQEDDAECEAAFTALAQIEGIARIDRVALQSVGGGMREPGLRGGIWRTLMLRVRDQASAGNIAGLERELLQMPQFMAGIRNWRLSRVETPGAWTHVWQQEFARVDDLLGEYLLHPFHWGWVDRWFDAEHPQWTVEAISHAFCPLASSLLTNPKP